MMRRVRCFCFDHHALPRTIRLVALLAIGCSGQPVSDMDEATTEPPKPNDSAVGQPESRETEETAVPVRVLALGDSYTIGESVDESDRWPNQLAERLRDAGVETDAPQIIARTGWTTGELLAAIDADKPTGEFDVVTLLIGVNNQYRGRTTDEFVRQLDELLTLATGYAGGEAECVVVLSIPDWGVTPFAADRDRDSIGQEIDRFNELKRQRAAEHGCQYVDVTPVSREAINDASLIADDGLHPSGVMYGRWSKLALPAAQRAISSRRN